MLQTEARNGRICGLAMSFQRIARWGTAKSVAFGTSPYVLFVVLIWAKLELAEATLGAQIGQVPPCQFLIDAFQGVLHGRSAPLYHSVYVVSLGSVLVLTAWTLMLSARSRARCLVALDLCLSLLILADTINYRYFHDFLSVSLVSEIGEAVGVHAAIGALLRPTDVLFAADLVLVLLLLVARRFIPNVRRVSEAKVHDPRLRLRFARTGGVLLVGSLAIFAPLHHAPTRLRNLLKNTWGRTALYQIVGLLGLHAIGTAEYVSQYLWKTTLPDSRVESIGHWFDAHRAHLSEKSLLWNAAPHRNIIVIQMEAFQDFVIGKRIGGAEITPNLNALLPHLLYFPNYFHQVGLGRTTDAELLSLCSLFPLHAGSAYTHVPRDQYDCLPSELKALGYKTVAFHGNYGSFWNRYRVYPRIGFDRFYSFKDFTRTEYAGWGVDDKDMLSQAAMHLMQLPSPFFAFLITITSHYPYELEARYDVPALQKLHPGLLENYVQTVHFLDAALGKFVEDLQRSGLWDDSIVVLYGDHDNAITNPVKYEPIFGRALTAFESASQVHRVGLFIHLPHDALAGVYPSPSAESDLAPTLFHILGLPVNHQFWMGDDVLASNHQVIPFWDGSFFDDQLFFQKSRDGRFDRSQCFDVTTKRAVDVKSCSVGSKEAIKLLRISQDVLRFDLIGRFRSKWHFGNGLSPMN